MSSSPFLTFRKEEWVLVPNPNQSLPHLDETHKPSTNPQRRPLLMVILGSLIASFGLDMFLVPNGFIAGGVTGISALASQITGLHTGMFLFMLNMPLVIFMFRQPNRHPAMRAAAALTVFSFCSLLLHPLPPLIEGGAAAAALGGIFLGLGIGICIQHGAVLDMLVHFTKLPPSVMVIINKFNLSHSRIVINVVILSIAGLLLGLEQAMYSAVACLLALEAAHLATTGFSLKREVIIRSFHSQDIENQIFKQLARTKVQQSEHLLYHIHLLELIRLKTIVKIIDPDASIVISPISRK